LFFFNQALNAAQLAFDTGQACAHGFFLDGIAELGHVVSPEKVVLRVVYSRLGAVVIPVQAF
jgi:hypothetical protein